MSGGMSPVGRQLTLTVARFVTTVRPFEFFTVSTTVQVELVFGATSRELRMVHPPVARQVFLPLPL